MKLNFEDLTNYNPSIIAETACGHDGNYKKLKSYKELNKDLKKFMENTNDPLLKKNFKWPREIQLTPENEENPEIVINCQD